MALLIPSAVVRVVILMPVLVSLLKAMGERPGSPVSAAVVLSLVCSTYYGGTGVLTGTVPNVMVLGALETRKIPVYWGQWAFLMFPVLGVLRVGCGYFIIRWLFRMRPHPPLLQKEDACSPLPLPRGEGGGQGVGEVTSPERKVLGILLLGILLWATDALHGVHPVYVGLLLVVLCYLPGWGPIAPDRLRTLNFPLLIYIAALFTLGRALEITGVTSRMAGFMTGIVDLSGSGALTKLGAIPWMVAPFDFLMDTAAVAGMLTPVLLDFGASLGLGPVPTALSVALGTGLVFIPYQSAPFVVAYSYRQVRMSQFILAMTLISLLTLLLLLPLHLLFWRLIGFV
jgi:Na+/H+ antiporter NhaD/arsenite permease-like protein